MWGFLWKRGRLFSTDHAFYYSPRKSHPVGWHGLDLGAHGLPRSPPGTKTDSHQRSRITRQILGPCHSVFHGAPGCPFCRWPMAPPGHYTCPENRRKRREWRIWGCSWVALFYREPSQHLRPLYFQNIVIISYIYKHLRNVIWIHPYNHLGTQVRCAIWLMF